MAPACIPRQTRYPSAMKVLLTLPLLAGLLLGCKDKREVRSYTDVRTPIEAVKPKSSGKSNLPVPPGMLPAASSDVAWTAPDGWTEEVGSGMRMATLFAGSGDDKVETSLIAFEDSGGVQPNLERWLGQVGINLGPAEIKSLIDNMPTIDNAAKLRGQFADLTAYSKPGAQSMLAGILALPDGRTLYIKATGTHDALVAARPDFLSLCQSVR